MIGTLENGDAVPARAPRRAPGHVVAGPRVFREDGSNLVVYRLEDAPPS